MSVIQINERFRALIPPLAPDEFATLEANIVHDGCREPLVVWGSTLVDGHNRFEICQRNKIKFTTTSIAFDDEDAACVWIIRNQLGRRNLPPFSKAELVLHLEPLLRKKAKEQQGKRTDILTNSSKSEPANTRRELAKQAGVSEDTIAKAKLVAEHADEETKGKLRRNEVSLNKVANEIKEKKEPVKAKQESRRYGTYEAWTQFRTICNDISDKLKELEPLRVDSDHVVASRDMASALCRRLEKIVNKIGD